MTRPIAADGLRVLDRDPVDVVAFDFSLFQVLLTSAHRLADAIREEHPEQAGPDALERLANRGEALRSRGHGRR